LRVAIAGTGFGEKYATGLTACPEVEVVAVYSRRMERAADMAERFGIASYTRDFDELLKIPYLDAVAIVTPNSTHAEFVQKALRARKHVICDKPLALNSREGLELLRYADSVGVKHVTFVPYRFSPASIAMKAALAAGQAGRTISVSGDWGVDLREEPLRWRFQRALSGAGVAADLGAHILDLLIWWAGPIRRVLGRCKMLVTERPLEAGGRLRPVDVPDECMALLEFAQAGIGSVKLSWNEKRDQRITIEGDGGRLTYSSPSLLQWLSGKGDFKPSVKLALSPSKGKETELPLVKTSFASPEDALAHMFRDIISYLNGAEKPDCVATFADGAEVLKVIDAIEASNESGKWVEVAS
jgi:predicted dehydrogenase